jgi:predicted nucleic-acid-binding protein
MIAVDTNVLLRYLLNDDVAQCGSFSGSYIFDKAAQKLQGAKNHRTVVGHASFPATQPSPTKTGSD